MPSRQHTSAKALHLQLLEAEDKTGPTKEPILWLHRHPDGVVHFMKGDPHHPERGLTPLRSISIAQLRAQPFLPKVLDGAGVDVFVSVNAFLRRRRTTEELRYLNAAYVDMDFYVREADGSITSAMKFGDAVGAMVRLSDEGLIPPPSIYVRSGNGAWLLWLLHNPEDTETSQQKAWIEKRAWLLNIQNRIRHVIRQAASQLSPDENASDLARVMRVPGSYSSKGNGNKQVVWLGAFDNRGELPAYTLAELGEWFRVPERVKAPRRPAGPKPRDGNTREARENSGQRAVWQYRLADLRLLAAEREGYREGYRHHALLAHASCMVKLGMKAEEIQAEIRSEAERCKPPLSSAQWQSIVRSATTERQVNGKTQRGYQLKNRRLAEQLGVTVTEADALNLRQIRPDFSTQYEKRYGHSYLDSPTRGTRQAKTEQRRAVVRQIVEGALASGGQVPPFRKIADWLRTAHGIKTNHQTVSEDLIVLGLHPKTIPERQQLLVAPSSSSPDEPVN
jgi:hypothetical protein